MQIDLLDVYPSLNWRFEEAEILRRELYKENLFTTVHELTEMISAQKYFGVQYARI